MNKHKIQGPVIPIPVPFNNDSSIDFKSLESYIDFLSQFNLGGLMTTAGTTSFNLLSREEIFVVNESVCRAAKGRVPIIVGNPSYGDINSTIEFASHSKKIGADYCIVYYPDRHYGDESIYDFFSVISKSVSQPLLIHEMPMRNGLGKGSVHYSIELLEKLFKLDMIKGIKEEALDSEYSNKIVKTFSSEVEIIGAGGGMSRFLSRDYDLGSKAFLGGIGNFNPQLEIEFHSLMMNNKFEDAKSLVETKELPLFDTVIPFGWHPSLKAMLSIKGFMKNINRKPMITLNDLNTGIIKTSMKSLKI